MMSVVFFVVFMSFFFTAISNVWMVASVLLGLNILVISLSESKMVS